MNEVYEDAINSLKYYGERNNRTIENIAYFLEHELKNYNKLQSNWNSLRECVDYQLKHNVGSSVESSIRNHVYQEIKDKMNELEKRNENE